MCIGDYYRRVLEVVEALTGVTKEQIEGKCRVRDLVDARCMVIQLMRTAGYYPRQISQTLGVSVRWVQKVHSEFDYRVRSSVDPMLRINWEQAAKILRSN